MLEGSPLKKNAATKEFGITLILTLDRDDLKNNAISTHEYNHEDGRFLVIF